MGVIKNTSFGLVLDAVEFQSRQGSQSRFEGAFDEKVPALACGRGRLFGSEIKGIRKSHEKNSKSLSRRISKA
jgi:hypothetical protein